MQIHGLDWRRLVATTGCCAAVVGLAACGASTVPAEVRPAGLTVNLGERTELLPPGALGLRYLPDEATSVVARHPKLQLLMAAGPTSYLVSGDSLEHLTDAQDVMGPGDAGSFDNGYAGMAGLHPLGDGTLFAIYHAEDHENLPQLTGGIPGYYGAVGSSRSSDGGLTWQKLGPVITSAMGKDWAAYPNQGDRGTATPSLVADRSGRYLYVYYDEHSRVNNRGVIIGLARTEPAGNDPTQWQWTKYYQGGFTQPGLAGLETPVVTLTNLGADALQAHVVFSADLDRYVMILGVSYIDEYVDGAPLTRSGMYLSFSKDGIEWAAPERLIADYAVPLDGQSLSWEGTLLWDEGSGLAGWLVYSFTPNWGTQAPFMNGRRLSFSFP